ncbi:hypothetical protein OOJ91_24615 [Micromonospora lupini]|uniref:hypothetical protein n=1 Tax=Micromonospora lupini TaxID=285679 RepID=UPI00225A1946|nr:hypothetical protein [Micromonospora lupini]MCX5069030.1 hypothetical protein [Micromonospora lupini]
MRALTTGRRRRDVARVLIALTAMLASALPATALVHTPAARADAAGGGGDFVPVAGTAVLLDTRSGTGATKGVRAAGSTTTVAALGVGGVPTSGVSAVLVRVAALKPTVATFLEVWPDGITRPNVTTLSAGVGEQISTVAVVKVGATGKISVYNSGATDIVLEAQGYFKSVQGSTGGGFVPTATTRLIDTRSGLGTTAGKIPAGGSRTVTITGTPVPAGAAAAVANVSVLGATTAGWLSVGPSGGSAHPLLNYETGTTQSAAVLALPSTGKVVITNKGSAAADVMVNVTGYFSASPTAGAGLRPVAGRLVNTRTVGAGLPVPANGTIDVQLGGTWGLPTRGIAGAALSVVVTPVAAGYLKVWPVGETEPGTTVMDFKAGVWRENAMVLKPGTDGKIRIRNGSSGTAHIVVDLQGWFADPLPATPVALNTPVAVLQGPPLVAGGVGALEYAYVDNSGNVRWGHQSDLDSFNSTKWTVISGGERFSGPPALAALADGRIQVSAQFRDGNIWSDAETTAGGPAWNPWSNLGGSMAAAPIAGKLAGGTVVQFAVDVDGRLWAYAQTGTVPYWRSLGDQDLTATLTAIRVQNGLRVFGVDTQGAVKTIEYYDDGSLSSWTSLGGNGLAGTPAVVARPGFQLQVFARSSAGTIVSKLQDINGGWPADWQTTGTIAADSATPIPAFAGAPAAVIAPTTGRATVVVRGTDSQLYQVTETATGTDVWGDWIKTVQGDVPESADPTILAYHNVNDDYLLIVCRDRNGTPDFYTPQ